MTTSSNPVPLTPRMPLRLRMAAHPGRGELDGGWWPQSRDLAVELADLVDHFPAERGRIVRTLFSPPDWDPAPRRIPVARGYVKVGSFPRDDTHLVLLKTADHAVLRVLVVPPGMSSDQGDEALLAAATPGYAHTAACLLDTVSAHPDVDPEDHWSDDGGTMFGPRAAVSSSRTGT
jgi:Family of unknown function (DUF5994)